MFVRSRSSRRGCFPKISVSPFQEIAFSRKIGKQMIISRKNGFLTIICFPIPADDVIIEKQIKISRRWHNKWENRYLFPKRWHCIENRLNFSTGKQIQARETNENFQERETDIWFLISFGKQIKILALKIVETDQLF